MDKIEQIEVDQLVARILVDSAAYEEIKEELEAVSKDDRPSLLDLLRTKNPPVLGTGTVG